MVLQARVTPPDWTDEDNGGVNGALCRRFPVYRDADGIVRNDAWFQEAAEAAPVCNGEITGAVCPMRRDCLLGAMINREELGVWGGLTTPQRRWIRRNVPEHEWRDPGLIEDVIARVPGPDHFKDYGDEDPAVEEEKFKRDQAEYARQEAQE